MSLDGAAYLETGGGPVLAGDQLCRHVGINLPVMVASWVLVEYFGFVSRYHTQADRNTPGSQLFMGRERSKGSSLDPRIQARVIVSGALLGEASGPRRSVHTIYR